MSHKKYMRVVNHGLRLKKALEQHKDDNHNGPQGTAKRFTNMLPEVYEGHPQRIERYAQYEQMDQDSDISKSLDIISDYSTRSNDKTGDLFKVKYYGKETDSEVQVITSVLNQWCRLNDFKKRIWRIFRNLIKYGDQFFVRDPETMQWYHVPCDAVSQIIVDEADGKKPIQYHINNPDLNLQSLSLVKSDQYGNNIMGTGTVSLQSTASTAMPKSYSSMGTAKGQRFGNMTNILAVDANHVIHLSLSEGLDAGWPFGTSVLESVLKAYKQKSLIEDAILIYRIQRAPERKVFYIDTGEAAQHKAHAILERTKNELQQRRIPSRNGTQSVVDATYNPLSILDDYYLAQPSNGRGSRIDVLPGGENLGVIDDLKYFDNKLIRGLGVPSSYLPTGPEDGTQTFNDGRLGTAYIQELQFSYYCTRLQNQMIGILDQEFKLYLMRRGYNIEANTFELEMHPPQNFAMWAQAERDQVHISMFKDLLDVDFISRRILLERYLGWSQEEISKNEELMMEELGPEDGFGTETTGSSGSLPGIESVGIRPTSDDEFDDMGSEDIDDTDTETTESPDVDLGGMPEEE